MWWFLACTRIEPGGPPAPPPTSSDGTRPPVELPLASADHVVDADRVGGSIAAADLDGDGDDDLLFGASGDDVTAGAVYAASWPLSDATAAQWVGESAGDQAGYALAAGDVDGDGVDDAIAGAFLADAVSTDAGATYLLTSSLSNGGLLADADGVVVDDQGSDHSGVALAVGSWLGEPTLAVGACMEDTADADAGAIFLLPEPGKGRTDLRDAVLVTGEHAGDASGSSIGAGDVDGDGLDDLVDGAWLDDEGGIDAGAAYLVLGEIDADRSLTQADAKLIGEGPGDFAASPCAVGGDLTGDGLPDIVVGAWFQDGGAVDGGAVYVVSGTRRGDVPLAQADAVFRGATAGSHWGVVASGPGDVDGDGSADLLLSGPDTAGGGRVGLFFGPVAGDLGPPPVVLVGVSEGDMAGIGLAFGDLDGDGRSDVLVGAGRGTAYVFSSDRF